MTTPTIMLQVGIRGGTAKPSVFRFMESEITIGSVENNLLWLGDPSVDARHARLIKKDDKYIVVDLKSTNGCFFNGKRVTSPMLFREGDVFSVGPYDLEIVHREPPGEREASFLDALNANPSDDETRTVYADWLEEQSRHDEAEFIRAQLSIRGLSPDETRFHQLSYRIQVLGPKMGASWRRTIARPPIERCPVRFELQCPKQWDQLKPTNDPNQRYCSGCHKNVHYASTVSAAQALALQGHCVSVDLTESRSEGDLDPFIPRMGGVIAPYPR